MELLRSALHWQKPDQKVHPISGTNSPIWGAEGVLSCLMTFAGVRVQISQAMCVCGSLSERLMCYGRGNQGHDRHRGWSHSLVENYGVRSFKMPPVQDYVCVHICVHVDICLSVCACVWRCVCLVYASLCMFYMCLSEPVCEYCLYLCACVCTS